MSFASLMALSATQTQQNNESVVRAALQQKEAKEATRRKEQEERERKEREMEKRLREKHFEDERMAAAKAEKDEQKRMREAEAMQKRKDADRDALRYGPKKAPKAVPYPSSNPDVRETIRKRRLPTDDDDVGERGGDASMALTREEKRERKLQAELKRTFGATRRTPHGPMHKKAGRKLPGGAVDLVESTPSRGSPAAGNIKARMAAMPNSLQMLNTVKRDVRTIDEIMRDNAATKQGKILAGEDARDFNDWFGTKKKQQQLQPKAAPSPSPPRPQPVASGSKAAPRPKPASAHQLNKKESHLFHSPAKPRPRVRTPPPPPTSSSRPKAKLSAPAPFPSSAKSRPQPPLPSRPAKRSRDESFSDDEDDYPPPKRDDALRDEIWKMFGKDRKTYVGRDDLSDDEDMEADAAALAREESRSSRLARKEDVEAIAAEKRHEEEKRRRREARERR